MLITPKQKAIKKFILAIFLLPILFSCSTNSTVESKKQSSPSKASGPNERIAANLDFEVRDALFEAWNDNHLKNAAVAGLLNQADKMMHYKQWDDARLKLERAIRISTRYAPTWSRLSWLSFREAQLKKSIQLAKRSNSYTQSNRLKILNWSFIRDAYRLMGKTKEMNNAKNVIQKLKSI